MDKKKKKILISLTAIFFIVCIAGIGTFYYYLLYPQFHPAKTVYVYVDRDDTADSIYNKVKAKGHPGNLTGFRWMAKYRELINGYINSQDFRKIFYHRGEKGHSYGLIQDYSGG